MASETPEKIDPSSDVRYPDMSLAASHHLLTKCGRSDLGDEIKSKVLKMKAVHLWFLWGEDLGWSTIDSKVKAEYDEEEKGLKGELAKAEER